jgi:hypothetical protein
MTVPEPDGRSERKRALLGRRLGVAVLAVVLALLLAELGLRFAAPRLPLARVLNGAERGSNIDRLAAGRVTRLFDPDLGWVPTPDFSQYRADERVHYLHNRSGLRADREFAPRPRAGLRRIAAYGDSFTYCTEVELADCWTERLEQLLPDSEVVNFGVPEYGPDQAWLRYQRDGAAWHPCTVLIGHMVENINRVVNRFRPFYQPATGTPLAKPRYVLAGDRLALLPSPAAQPDLLKDPTWVEANLGPQDAWYAPGRLIAGRLDRLELTRWLVTMRYRLERQESLSWGLAWAARMYRPGGEAFQVTAAVLEGFAGQVRADGATPVVLVFPTRDEIAARRDGQGRLPHALLLDRLRSAGVATLDLTDYLGEAASSAELADLMAPEGHYSPGGNAVVARALADRLPALSAATCNR